MQEYVSVARQMANANQCGAPALLSQEQKRHLQRRVRSRIKVS